MSEWTRVHQQLALLGRSRAAQEREVCRWLVAAQRLGVHARAGYGSFAELADRLLGLNGRATEERLRVGRALAALPSIDRAFATGELPWAAVRELTRVATRETEEAWLRWANGRRVREIELAVAARAPGDGPRDPADPSRVKHRLTFQVGPETMALFRELQAAVRADLGSAVDDDGLLREIARRALGGPGDEGRASYQIAVSRCDACGRGRIDAGGESFGVDAGVVERALCDGELLEPEAGVPVATSGAPVRVSAGAADDDGLGARPPAGPRVGESGSSRGLEARRDTSTGGASSAPVEGGPRVGDRRFPRGIEAGGGSSTGGASSAPVEGGPRVGAKRRAKQTISPALRRDILRRDGRRCIVPGCSGYRYLDVHHIDPRCEGGGNDPERLTTLCGAHHSAVHAGVLCIDGHASKGFVVRHGDGTGYGSGVDVARLDAARQVVGALQHMGFTATQARKLVDDAVRAGASRDRDGLLRAALVAS